MKRLYVALLIFSLLLACNTLTLQHAQSAEQGVLSLDVQDIRRSSSIPHAIEIIGKTDKELRKFVIQESIPVSFEKYINQEQIDTLCQELLSQIKGKQIQLVWLDQIYAIVSENNQKDAIRFKHLFLSRLYEKLPLEEQEKESLAESEKPSQNLDPNTIPTPTIPENFNDFLDENKDSFEETPSQKANDKEMQSPTTIPRIIHANKERTEEERLQLSTAMGGAYSNEIKNRITPEESFLLYKKIIEDETYALTQQFSKSTRSKLRLLSSSIAHTSQEEYEAPYQDQK